MDPNLIRVRRQEEQLRRMKSLGEAFDVMGQQLSIAAINMARGIDESIIETMRKYYESD